MTEQELWYGRGLGAAACRMALAPASGATALFLRLKHWAYAAGLKKPYRASVPVVCVGNLIAGGSGKSPLVLHVHELLKQAGRHVVISCSGYGTQGEHGATLVPDGDLDPVRWGDEPAMFRSLLPDTPLIVGRDRVMAAKKVEAEFPNSVLLLDDGFQHIRLFKTVSIVLDADGPNRWCLPAGPYREPRGPGRARASLVLPGRFHVSSAFSAGDPEPCQALCAIGQPQLFLQDAADAGWTMRASILRRDHDPLLDPELLASFDPKLPILTTAKDWVKLQRRPDSSRWRWIVATKTARVDPPEEFRAWLLGALS